MPSDSAPRGEKKSRFSHFFPTFFPLFSHFFFHFSKTGKNKSGKIRGKLGKIPETLVCSYDMITTNQPGRVFDGADMGGVEVVLMSVPHEVSGIQNPEKKSSIGVSNLSPIF